MRYKSMGEIERQCPIIKTCGGELPPRCDVKVGGALYTLLVSECRFDS